jgi:hypothetical protein
MAKFQAICNYFGNHKGVGEGGIKFLKKNKISFPQT